MRGHKRLQVWIPIGLWKSLENYSLRTNVKIPIFTRVALWHMIDLVQAQYTKTVVLTDEEVTDFIKTTVLKLLYKKSNGLTQEQ